MKRILFFAGAITLSVIAFCQDDLNRLIREGIDLHDRGYFEEAIRKYDSVLQKDKMHYLANYEKSYTLQALHKFDESIAICKFLIETDPKNRETRSVYVNWGTALDEKGESEEALNVYNEGIKTYPGFYLLHFNKGITLGQLKKNDDALLAFQRALACNPLHAGSHQLIGRVIMNTNRIPAFMAFFTFLLIEPKSERASDNYMNMNRLIMKGISDNPDGKGTTINIDASALDKKNKNKENDFSSLDMMFSLTSALDKDEKFKDQNEAEKLDRKVQLLAGMLKEQQKKMKGFYWEFYAPFFIDLKEKDYLLTACYVASINSDNPPVANWLKENKDKVDEFYKWLEGYTWKRVQ